ALSLVADKLDQSFGVQALAGFTGQLKIAAIGAGVLAGTLVAVGPAAALAAAGAVGVFAGIGIAAAAQSEQVKTAFTGLKDHVVTQMQAMAAPIVPVLVDIAGQAPR